MGSAAKLSKARPSEAELLPDFPRIYPMGFVCCVTQRALNTSTAEGVGVQTPTLPLLPPATLPILALHNENKPHQS